MKKIIYLLMSLSIVALASCNDDDKTSSSPSNAISAADMKKMAGKTLVITEKYENSNRTSNRTTEYIFDSNGRLSKMREEYHDEEGTDTDEEYWDYSNPNCIVHYDKTEANDPYDFDTELFEQCGGDHKQYRFYNTLYYYNNELYYWGEKYPRIAIIDGNAYKVEDTLYYVYSDEHVKSYKNTDYLEDLDGHISVQEYDYHFTNGRLTEKRYVWNSYMYDKLEYKDDTKTVYEYDSKGNCVSVKKTSTRNDRTDIKITYTDIKASDLPIEDRIALTIICNSGDIRGVGYSNVGSFPYAISNHLIKHQEISIDDISEDYTYYLKDKKVKIDETSISGDYNREYSWYVK